MCSRVINSKQLGLDNIIAWHVGVCRQTIAIKVAGARRLRLARIGSSRGAAAGPGPGSGPGSGPGLGSHPPDVRDRAARSRRASPRGSGLLGARVGARGGSADILVPAALSSEMAAGGTLAWSPHGFRGAVGAPRPRVSRPAAWHGAGSARGPGDTRGTGTRGGSSVCPAEP